MFLLQNPIIKMANGSLYRLVWQFRHLWQERDKVRLSIECEHDGKAFASLHRDLGQQCGGQHQQQAPPTTTHPPKSRHTQTQPINLSVDQGSDPAGRSGPTTTESIGTQASETVESVDVSVNTDT